MDNKTGVLILVIAVAGYSLYLQSQGKLIPAFNALFNTTVLNPASTPSAIAMPTKASAVQSSGESGSLYVMPVETDQGSGQLSSNTLTGLQAAESLVQLSVPSLTTTPTEQLVTQPYE
jgi:hypothetical protein